MRFFSGQFLVAVIFWQNSGKLFALSHLHTDDMLIHAREHAGSLPCKFKRIVFQVGNVLLFNSKFEINGHTVIIFSGTLNLMPGGLPIAHRL